ncbi:MAG: hypothetical protein PHQ43_00840 [Dehalococcoidales bacterium]|nr:hypothetical protein [Dehalococcoidales bacterium]
MVNINPKAFQDEPLCHRCFEDALKIGSSKSDGLKPHDFKETSIRFCVDGLLKWYKSFAKHYGKSSVFVMVRDASWWWASFCGTDPTLTKLVKEYYDLLKDITENTDYTDLAERMDETFRTKEIGRGGRPFNISIPFECHGIIADCATAIGMPFAIFYQLGLAKALSTNRNSLYAKWVTSTVNPLFDEVMGHAKSRAKVYRRIRNDMAFRDAEESENE